MLDLSFRTALSGLLTALLCTSCVSSRFAVYQPPATGRTADLQIVTLADGMNMSVVRYTGGMSGCECSAAAGEIIAILHNRMVGAREFADHGKDTDSVSVKVPADGDDFRMFMNVANYAWTRGLLGPAVETKGCQAHVSFRPSPGRSYLAVYDYHDPCTFSIYEKTGDGNVPVTTTRYPPCVFRKDPSDVSIRFAAAYCAAHPDEYH